MFTLILALHTNNKINRMFEVATQYNAIFRAQTSSPEGSTSLLSMWTSRRVHSFLAMLEGQLNRMEDSAALRDALEASVFFSTSMGRLGADFTAQLPVLFENKMLFLVEQAWKDAPQQLEETLKVCRDAGIGAPLISQNVPESTPTMPANTATADGQPMPPPRSLMALPPLARVVNAILIGLNDLRRCLLPGIFTALRASLESVIADIKRILSVNEKTVNAPTLRGEKRELREAASRMRITFKNLVEPYLRGSLEMALGNFDAAEAQYDIIRRLEEEERQAALAEEAQAMEAEKQKALKAQGGVVENTGVQGQPGDEAMATQLGQDSSNLTQEEQKVAEALPAPSDEPDFDAF